MISVALKSPDLFPYNALRARLIPVTFLLSWGNLAHKFRDAWGWIHEVGRECQGTTGSRHPTRDIK